MAGSLSETVGLRNHLSVIIAGFNSPDLDTKRAGQLWMSCTIENGKTYPRTPIHELKKRFKIDKIIGPSLHDADMYVSFYSQFYTGAEAIRR
eukprot:1365059-Amorphochlora_amoeboformis.AAC.2